MDQQHPETAGDLSAGKEGARREAEPELKTRRAKLLRRIREDRAKQFGLPVDKMDNATTGDDFYTDVLARFGIEI